MPIAGNMGDCPDTGQNMGSRVLEGGNTVPETAILDADDVNGVPKGGDPFTTVTSKANMRRAAQAARQSEWQNQVSASNFTSAESIKKETVVIVKPEETEGSELISSSKARKLALDNSPFKTEGILQVTPNHAKKLFVVSVPVSADIHKLCQITNLGGLPVKFYLPFNTRVESRVIQNAEESISDNDVEEALEELGLPYERVIRLHRTIDGKRTPIRTVRVDFLCPAAAIPHTIAINYTRHRIGIYEHAPVQCYNCQDWGHMSKSCRATRPVCAKCAGEHDTSKCTLRAGNMKCANCNGPHPTYSKDCPHYKLAKQ